jgi:hypothetical protein
MSATQEGAPFGAHLGADYTSFSSNAIAYYLYCNKQLPTGTLFALRLPCLA